MVNELMGMKMLGTINKVILIGSLVKDPEIKVLQSGDVIATLLLMICDSWENKRNQNYVQKTEYFKIVVFSKFLIKFAEERLKKDDYIYLEGQLRIRKWQDNEENNRYSTEIVLFSHNGVLVLLNDNQNGLLSSSNKLSTDQALQN